MIDLIEAQSNIIRQLLDIVDELYVLLAQHLSDDEDLAVFAQMKETAEKLEGTGNGVDSMEH